MLSLVGLAEIECNTFGETDTSTMAMVFSMVELRKKDLLEAAELSCGDYENTIQSVCAARVQTDYIVTRDEKYLC